MNHVEYDPQAAWAQKPLVVAFVKAKQARLANADNRTAAWAHFRRISKGYGNVNVIGGDLGRFLSSRVRTERALGRIVRGAPRVRSRSRRSSARATRTASSARSPGRRSDDPAGVAGPHSLGELGAA